MTDAAHTNTKPAQNLIAPLVVVLGWAVVFVWSLITIHHNSLAASGRRLLDLNNDGATTIRDVLLLLWSSWCWATLQPLIWILEVLERTAPRALKFFEVGAALDALGWANVLVGLGLWAALFFGLISLELRVRDAFKSPKAGGA